MPLGSRFVVISALATATALAGCQNANKQTALPLRASVAPVSDSKPSARAETASPVVKNSDFQKKIPVPTAPQPGVTPPVNVPTIPTTGYPMPAMNEPTPPAAPDLAGTPQPPIAESGSTGGIVMPSLFEKK